MEEEEQEEIIEGEGKEVEEEEDEDKESGRWEEAEMIKQRLTLSVWWKGGRQDSFV